MSEDGKAVASSATELKEQTGALKVQASDLMEKARALKIVDDASYQIAANIAKSFKALEDEIIAKFKTPKDLANKAHKAITSLEAELLAPPRNGMQVIKLAIGNYQMEQARLRRIEEARIAEEAKRRREEAQLNEAMELEAAGNQAAAEGDSAEAERKKAEAEAVVSRPVVAPLVSLPKPKAEGITEAMVWKFEIVDITKLNLAALKSNPKFIEAVTSAIRPIVNSMRDQAHTAIGEGVVRIWQEAQPRVTNR